MGLIQKMFREGNLKAYNGKLVTKDKFNELQAADSSKTAAEFAEQPNATTKSEGTGKSPKKKLQVSSALGL